MVTEACTNLLKHARRRRNSVCASRRGGRSDAGARSFGARSRAGHAPIWISACGTASARAVLRAKGWGRSCGSRPHRIFIRVPGEARPYWRAGRTAGSTSRAPDSTASLRIGAINVPSPDRKFAAIPGAWSKRRTDRRSWWRMAGPWLEAAQASLEAVRMLHLNPELPPQALIERVHQALRSSRGAAVAVARIDRATQQSYLCRGRQYCGANLFRRRSRASIWFR